MRLGAAWLCALALAGCSPRAPRGPASACPGASACTLEGWTAARARLEALRGRAGGARTERIALTVREPTTGKTIEARGAVAVRPPDDLRMILVGPGGTTALDVWVHEDRYRLAVPALDLVRKGSLRDPPETRRGLPIDFLRGWLLRPASGELLWHARAGSADRFTLRDEGAVVEVTARDDGRVEAHRRGAFEETLEAEKIGCGAARYRQRTRLGLEVGIRCEGLEPGPPLDRAFVDPEAATR